MPVEVPPRSQVPREYTWDTESVFRDDEAWEKAIAALREALAELEGFRGRLGEGPDTLVLWFERLQATEQLGRINVYAENHHNVDTTDPRGAALSDRATALVAEVLAATSFAEPELLAVVDRLDEWVRQDPRLTIYSHYVEDLARMAAHVRSPEVEELLGRLVDPFETAAAIHGTMADADLQFRPARSSAGEELPVTQGSIDALLADPDREVRRTAWESYADAHLEMRHSMANCLSTAMKQHVFVANARRYRSTLDAALDENRIPPAVYYNVIDTVRANLPVWHRYWRVRRRALGYDRLHVYDIKAPLSASSPEIPLARAVDLICEGMAPLGDEYVGILRRGVLQERWVDVYPNQNKRAGAYSSGSPGTYPFILMSYTDDLESVSTLAHELGHSVHSYYSWRTQPVIYADYSIFAAEVASNVGQALVRRHLLETFSERDWQIGIIEEAMSNYHRYFFLMPILARFELEIHRRAENGDPLTAESLMDQLLALFTDGYGGEVEIDPERIGITWAQFPTHLYSDYYVYQYTTGIAGAHALVQQVLDEGAPAVERYVGFLKAGGSEYPIEALRRAGVDLTTPEPIQAAFDYLDSLVGRLEQLVSA